MAVEPGANAANLGLGLCEDAGIEKPFPQGLDSRKGQDPGGSCTLKDSLNAASTRFLRVPGI